MKRFPLAVAALCASALALAGCNSDADSNSDNSPKPNAPSTPAFTGDPIKVGLVAPMDKAAFGNPQPEIRSAAMAAADAINQAGGINGHEFKVVACDDGYDPNRAAECGRKFVKEGVVAVVGSQTTQYQTYGPIIEAAGIPNVGSLPLGNYDYMNAGNYPLVPGAIGLFGGDVVAAKMAGKKSVAMVGLATAGGEAQAGLIESMAKSAGLEFKGYTSLPTDSSDLSPAIRAVEKTGADAVILGLDKVSMRLFMTAMQASGAKFTPAHSPEVMTPDILEAAPQAAEGMILASPFPPYDDTSFPGLVEYNKEMDAREATGDKHAGESNRQTILITWMAMHAFADVVKGIQGDITAESVTQAVKTAKDIDLGVGWKWSPSVRNIPPFTALSSDNVYFSTVKDGKIVLTNKDPVHVLGGK